jgi:glutamate-1-semialdehyde 2,1-aminomutase
VQAGWQELAGKYNLKINVSGISPLSHWKVETNNSQLLHTIIVEKLLGKGFLSSEVFYPTYTHTENNVAAYLGALGEILNELEPYIKEDKLEELPHGPIAHSGFRRLT